MVLLRSPSAASGGPYPERYTAHGGALRYNGRAGCHSGALVAIDTRPGEPEQSAAPTARQEGRMKISLRQKGGLFGAERNVDLSEAELEVTDRGVQVTKRTLRPDESARVDELARRLIAKNTTQEAGALDGVSDSMLTEVEIGDEDGERTYRVRSGEDADAELWELVGTLREVAESPIEERTAPSFADEPAAASTEAPPSDPATDPSPTERP
jgi:hypothetical protein